MTHYASRLLTRAATVTLTAAAVAVATAGTASATTITAANAALAVNTTFGAPLAATTTEPLGTATIDTHSGVATCRGGRFDARVAGPNPKPSVVIAPTTFALGSAVAGGSCTDTISGLDITGVSLLPGGTGSATTTTSGGTGTGVIDLTGITLRVSIATPFAETCDFTVKNTDTTAVGMTSNATKSVLFSNVPLDTPASAGACSLIDYTLAQPTRLTARFGALGTSSFAVYLD